MHTNKYTMKKVCKARYKEQEIYMYANKLT